MKKKVLICVLTIIAILVAVVFVNKMNSKTKEEQFSYKLEYVKSLKDIDESLPTVIFFKGLINEKESLEYEIMLKDLKEESDFNLVHVSLDYITNEEQENLINEYKIIEVPTIVLKDKNQIDIASYNHITYEKLQELINNLD
ncbi:viral A-type inclusion protein [Clostridium botulinum]|uniref:viral A-type inclusion protein n=1 Tax=Clostridium botulinum TaxID=1491 RepID=UPI0013F06D52|nr:viral A-type inclusion protein [Clostridium botulinum]MBN1040548.1 viral A-type inclusion protein [Clostridium botulinum]NFH90208.1 viral A-type inclusion protein [Clostridium botulinum]NFI16468.1 viral A-type inclusion protein [Clostridium botulinum]NFL91742.1 viral A-type inclusion protein [Clostridium botulinum]NFN51167.1 viral A-type inclusion protein [Clostridium botulinum]